MTVQFHRAHDAPQVGEWVLAYWRHMYQPCDRHKRAQREHGGWYRSVLRNNGFWTTQFSPSSRMRVYSTPLFWTAILLPNEIEDLKPARAFPVMPSQRGGLVRAAQRQSERTEA